MHTHYVAAALEHGRLGQGGLEITEVFNAGRRRHLPDRLGRGVRAGAHVALERIETFGLLDEQFEPQPRPAGRFAHSFGVHTGKPVHVAKFEARVADYLKECESYKSQEMEERPDGSLLVRLEVCVDAPLKSWILSFGPLARVLARLRSGRRSSKRSRRRVTATRPLAAPNRSESMRTACGHPDTFEA